MKRTHPRPCFSGIAMLKDAAVNDDANLVKELLDSRKRLEITTLSVNETLLKACKSGSSACVEVLLRQGAANVDYQDDDLWTPLHIAAANSQEYIVHVLVKFHADPTLLDANGSFAIDYTSDQSIRDTLLWHMANNGVYAEDMPSIRSRMPNAMLTAVTNAINRKKDLNALNKNGVSPLHTAAANGYMEVARRLIASGINIDCQDNEGLTPVYVAIKFHQMDFARLLIANGADTSMIDAEELSLLSSSPATGTNETTADDGTAYFHYHLYKCKVSDISREDRLQECETLQSSGHSDQVQDRLQTLMTSLSFESPQQSLPEMIYEDAGNFRQSLSPAHPVEEQYDTFIEVRKAVRTNTGQISDSGSSIEDPVYDDGVSLASSKSANQLVNNGEDEDLYDDALSVKQSMGMSVGVAMSKQINNEEEDLYDDAIAVRKSISETSSTNQQDELYDDVTSLKRSIVNGGVATTPTTDNDTYDDAVTLRQSLVGVSNTGPQGDTVPIRDRSVSVGGQIRGPLPYEKIQIRPDTHVPPEPIYDMTRRKKMTTRRKPLPLSPSGTPTPDNTRLGRRPLTVHVTGHGEGVPKSPERSPDGKRKSASEQVTVLSPNVPVAWQYRMQSKGAGQSAAISKQTTPTDPSPYEEQPIVPSRMNHLQEASPYICINNQAPPIPPKPHPQTSPDPNQYQIHHYASIKSPPNPAHSAPPRPASPTYMTIPERKDIYSSFSSSSGEYSPSPSPSREDVTPSGMKKIQLGERKSVPVTNSHPPTPPHRVRRRVTNGHTHVPPGRSPKPIRSSNPFQI